MFKKIALELGGLLVITLLKLSVVFQKSYLRSKVKSSWSKLVTVLKINAYNCSKRRLYYYTYLMKNPLTEIAIILSLLFLFVQCEPVDLGPISVMNKQTFHTPDKSQLNKIQFLNEQVGVVASSDSNVVYCTQDGGVNWTTFTTFGKIENLFSNNKNELFIAASYVYKTTDNGLTWEKMMNSQDGAGCNSSGDIFLVKKFFSYLDYWIYSSETGDLIEKQQIDGYMLSNVIISNSTAVFYEANQSDIQIFDADDYSLIETGHPYLANGRTVQGIYMDELDTIMVSREAILDISKNYYDNPELWSQYGDNNQYDFQAIDGLEGLFVTVGEGAIVTNKYTVNGDWTTVVSDDYTPYTTKLGGVQIINNSLIYAVGDEGTLLKCKL